MGIQQGEKLSRISRSGLIANSKKAQSRFRKGRNNEQQSIQNKGEEISTKLNVQAKINGESNLTTRLAISSEESKLTEFAAESEVEKGICGPKGANLEPRRCKVAGILRRWIGLGWRICGGGIAGERIRRARIGRGAQVGVASKPRAGKVPFPLLVRR